MTDQVKRQMFAWVVVPICGRAARPLLAGVDRAVVCDSASAAAVVYQPCAMRTLEPFDALAVLYVDLNSRGRIDLVYCRDSRGITEGIACGAIVVGELCRWETQRAIIDRCEKVMALVEEVPPPIDVAADSCNNDAASRYIADTYTNSEDN